MLGIFSNLTGIIILSAVKKGRYSHEKRAETIIQSRMYWENLQQMQEGARSTSDYSYTTYAEPQTATAETPLPALKDVWPTHQSSKMSPTAQYDPYAVSTTVPTTYTPTNYVYERNDTTDNYAQERNDHQEEMALMYVDGRPVTITTNETDHEEPIRETHITEVEITSPDYIDYSRLGPSAKDIVVDGKALLDGFSSILNQMHNNYEALKADNSNANSEASTSEICQLQIDGLSPFPALSVVSPTPAKWWWTENDGTISAAQCSIIS